MSPIAPRLPPGPLVDLLLPKASFGLPRPETGNDTLVGSTWRGAMLNLLKLLTFRFPCVPSKTDTDRFLLEI